MGLAFSGRIMTGWDATLGGVDVQCESSHESISPMIEPNNPKMEFKSIRKQYDFFRILEPLVTTKIALGTNTSHVFIIFVWMICRLRDATVTVYAQANGT